MYEELKKRRLELEKTLEEIAEETKIKKSYLQFIEEGDFDKLPIAVYTRAYIITYAKNLGVDPSAILKDYENYLQSKQNTKREIELNDIESSDQKTSFFKKLPNWSITLAVIFIVFFIVFLLIKSERKEQILPPPPPVKQETNSEISKIEEKIETNMSQQESPVKEQKLIIETSDKVWMRITIDDRDKREFLLNPGQKIQLQANKSFRLHIGNAGGVKVLFNGKDMGKIGETGQVVYLNLPQEKN
ncbi:hypothetical protein TAGGR_1242 [Thermodesulfovibrio aggregans]|uniref:HTH cro/C1-type domain-containing protein n=1 Tax=Thermodesulfovibrio aggregans TaxID=86166 RepID=A0A0U9I8K5_9BACT|nr:helix-turn-helix domain-containing protein [Thermodesulfovibrio aggregans]GAQ94070.1 hypothetical protein TAGGR_1242 [Thermodesulfovibrio aggregans]